MIPWSRLERRWCEALLAAVIPPGSALPGCGSIALEAFWRTFDASVAPLLAFGLRATTWVLVLLGPLLVLGQPRLFTSLTPERQDELLVRAAASHRYLLRQMAVTLKAIACFAFLSDPGVRAAVAARP